jgi:8-oxo-dGTP pyrophosphatase MutT (NUDIX family)
MTTVTIEQLPIRLRGRKSNVRSQFAALCYRRILDQTQICLVTSRGSGRWILPKGWPVHNQTPAQAAAAEAFEEAGLSGHAFDTCLGVFSYTKPLDKSRTAILALVYPVHVTHVHTDWPEQHQRRRKWFTPAKAAAKIAEPELRRIVESFDPAHLLR